MEHTEILVSFKEGRNQTHTQTDWLVIQRVFWANGQVVHADTLYECPQENQKQASYSIPELKK